jgi:hypothetical protein
MKKETKFTFVCEYCGESHTVLLDESGHFSGHFPCDPIAPAELQIDPEEWRRLADEEAAKTKH